MNFTRALAVAILLASGSAPAPAHADPACIAVTELMIDPVASPDASGEWIELANYSLDTTYDLDGWSITDAGGRQSYAIDARLIVPPGAFLVLAASGDSASNGGIVPDVVYGPALPLNNQGDTVRIVDVGGEDVDVVTYDGGQVTRGAALACRIADAGSNDDAEAWFASTTPLPGGDTGTPGGPNEHWRWGRCDGRTDLGDDAGPTTAPVLALAGANPGRPPIALTVELAARSEVALTVFDALGRILVRIEPGLRAAGRHRIVWDGRRAGGSLAAAGRYWLRITTADGVGTVPVALVR